MADDWSLTISVASLVVSGLSLVVAGLSYWQANKKAEDAKRASALGLSLQAINNVRNALWDVKFDGNTTTKTTNSIRDAAHLSTLIFEEAITQTLEAARRISYELENTPSERQTAQYDGRKAELAGKLEAVLELMKKQASLRG
jgi:hypothetical protein